MTWPWHLTTRYLAILLVLLPAAACGSGETDPFASLAGSVRESTSGVLAEDGEPAALVYAVTLSGIAADTPFLGRTGSLWIVPPLESEGRRNALDVRLISDPTGSQPFHGGVHLATDAALLYGDAGRVATASFDASSRTLSVRTVPGSWLLGNLFEVQSGGFLDLALVWEGTMDVQFSEDGLVVEGEISLDGLGFFSDQRLQLVASLRGVLQPPGPLARQGPSPPPSALRGSTLPFVGSRNDFDIFREAIRDSLFNCPRFDGCSVLP